MRVVATLARWDGILLLGGLLAVVLWKLLTGGISLSQLLEGDVPDPNSKDGYSTATSAGRTQSLGVTLFVAGYFLLQVVHNPREFPRLPDALVAGFGASQALYLGGKAQAMLGDRIREFFYRRIR